MTVTNQFVIAVRSVVFVSGVAGSIEEVMSVVAQDVPAGARRFAINKCSMAGYGVMDLIV